MSEGSPLLIIGTGDHARVMIDVARAAGIEPSGCLEPGDNRVSRDGARVISGVPVLGPLNVDNLRATTLERARFVVAVGSNQRRREAFDRCLEVGLEPTALIHPSAVLLGDAVVEPGAQVCGNAVIGVAARIGPNAIINTAATVDHDNVVGAHAMIGPGAHLAGRVKVGPGAQVGIGASVREGIRIGAWSLVAAGAVVVRDVEERARVAGVPARPLQSAEEAR